MMKQTIYFIKILAILAAVLLLGACGHAPDLAGAEGAAANEGPAASGRQPEISSQQPGVSSPRTDGPNIRQVGTEGGAGQQAGGDNGFYELISVFPNSCSIFYTDYAANRQVYLCSSPGCDHAGEYCTSYVDTSAGNIPGLIFSNHRLFLIWPPSAGAAVPAQIEVMDANGANRTVLAKLKASQSISLGWYLADESFLYFLLEEAQSDGSFTEAVCSMDQTNGEVHVLLELEQGGWIMDGQGSCIYLKSIEEGDAPDRDLFETEEAFMDAVWAGNVHKILKMDVSDPHTLTVVDEWRQNERSGGMLNGKMYYYDFSQNCFVEKDYETGESTAVQNTTGIAFSRIYPQAVIDGKLVFTGVTARESDKNHISSFYVDFAGRAADEIGIMDARRNRPVTICASDADKIYAYYDTAEESILFELDGDLETTVIARRQLGYISKQDFWSGVAAFTPCVPAA